MATVATSVKDEGGGSAPSRGGHGPPLPRALRKAAVVGAVAGVLLTGVATPELSERFGRPAVALPAVLAVAALAGVAILARFEAFVLALLVTRSSLDYFNREGGPDLNALVALAFIAAALAWVAAQRGAGPLAPSSAARGALAFVAASSVAVVGSTNPATSAALLARFVSFVLMVLVLERLVDDWGRLQRLLIALFISAVLPVATGIYQGITRNNLYYSEGFERVTGTFAHPNSYGIYLVIVVLMGVAVLPSVTHRSRLGLLVLLAGALVCLVMTYARAAWIALVVGLLLMGLIHSRKFVVLVLVGVISAVVFVPSVGGRFSDLERPEAQLDRTSYGAPPNSLAWRLGFWGQTVQLAAQRPLTGIGLDMVPQHPMSNGLEVHNDFVRAYAESGAIGLLGYLALLGGLAVTARRSLRLAPSGLPRGVAVGFAGCAIAFVTFSITDNAVSRVVVLWYLAAVTGAAIAASRLGPNPGARPR